MIELHSLLLNNYELYPEIEFDFSKGVTVVQGKNRSGKSLLFSALKPILYGTDKTPAGSKATLVGVHGGMPFTATTTNTGKSNRYALSLDGVDQQTDTIAKARAVIDKFVGVSESVFDTTVHLSGLRKHPLADGKPSDRLDWIYKTLAFSEVYDVHAEIVEAQIKTVRDKAVEHGLLLKELKALEADAPKKPKKEQVEIDDTLKEQVSSLYAKIEALEVFLDLPPKPERKPDKVKSLLDAAKDKLRAMQEAREAFMRYKAAMELYREQAESNKKNQSRIDALRDELKAPEVDNEKLLPMAQKQLEKTTSRIKTAIKNNREYEQQEPLRRFFDKKTELVDTKIVRSLGSPDIVPKTEKQYNSAMEILTEQLDDAKAMHRQAKGECSYCGKDLSKDQGEWYDRIRLCNRVIGIVETNWKIVQAREVTPVKPIDIEPLEERKEKLDKLISLLSRVSTVKKPKEVEFDAEAFEKLESKVADLRSEYREAQAYYDKVGDDPVDPAIARKKIKRLRAELSEKQATMLEQNEARIKHETELALWNKYQKQHARLTEKLEELKEYPRLQKIMLAFRAAFGRDGLRVDRLNDTLELFVANLNACAEFVFTEPFKFDIEVGPRRCDVIVHRNGKKGTAFTLSGSEQRGWQLVSAMAMLRILPDSFRFNTIILDELEANMDDTSRAKFVTDYLPELKKLVDNVILVTPLSEKTMYVPADRRYRVSKSHGVSKITEI